MWKYEVDQRVGRFGIKRVGSKKSDETSVNQRRWRVCSTHIGVLRPYFILFWRGRPPKQGPAVCVSQGEAQKTNSKGHVLVRPSAAGALSPYVESDERHLMGPVSIRRSTEAC